MGVPGKIFVIGLFRYIPSLRDDWEGSILWVPQRKISPSSGRSRERRKIKSRRIFLIDRLISTYPLTILGQGALVLGGVCRDTAKLFLVLGHSEYSPH